MKDSRIVFLLICLSIIGIVFYLSVSGVFGETGSVNNGVREGGYGGVAGSVK